jgi:hypothetical protein
MMAQQPLLWKSSKKLSYCFFSYIFYTVFIGGLHIKDNKLK